VHSKFRKDQTLLDSSSRAAVVKSRCRRTVRLLAAGRCISHCSRSWSIVSKSVRREPWLFARSESRGTRWRPTWLAELRP